jgi:Protein of unknown function (DUF3108)
MKKELTLSEVRYRSPVVWCSAVFCLFILAQFLAPCPLRASEQADSPVSRPIRAFMPGEQLTYAISWSNIITAGIAVMTVTEDKLPDGGRALKFTAKTHSVGVVDAFYPVSDTVLSVFDPVSMQSLSFSLDESHGGKKRRRTLLFDHARNVVVSRVNYDPPRTLPVPNHVQDALSALYYLRTRDDFTVGKAITIDVHDSGKNWSVDVQVLGREEVRTPAGRFSTIKVKTYPKYEGVFMNKGEIFIWLTDDIRKIPVLMKSTISIGSIVTTLTGMKPGTNAP